jgi:uncharacterized membrane protein
MKRFRNSRNRETSHNDHVLEVEGRSGVRRVSGRSITIVLLILLSATGFWYFGTPHRIRNLSVVSISEAAVSNQTIGNDVVYPETAFVKGKAKFFDYKTADGKKVRYFIIKSSDGVIRAAFDACDVCWESGKGYKQDGDFMVCQNCGRRFQSTKVNVVTGGCNPSALTRSIKDGNVIITTLALDEGKRLFK